MITLPKLLELTQGLDSGVFPDRHAYESFVWDTGENVLFSEGGVRKMPGWDSPFTKTGSDPVRGGVQQEIGATKYIFYGDKEKLYRWDNATPDTLNTGYTGVVNESAGTIATAWSMVDFGAWILATNGVDQPQIYKGATFANLGGTPPSTIEIFAKSGPFILGFNTSNDEREVVWCDQDDPEDWVPLSTNAAGDLIIRELNSRIICVKPLGDNLAIYGTDSMAVMRPLSAPLYFGYKMALNGIGAVSKESVVSIGRSQYGLGIQGFFVTDGSTFKYIDEGVVRQQFLSEFNQDQKSKVVSFHNEESTEIVWYYPSGASLEPDRGISYNYRTGAWSFRGHGRTTAMERNIFEYPITAGSTGIVFFENFGNDDDGNAMECFVQSRPFPFANDGGNLDRFIKYIDMVKLGIKDFTGTGIFMEFAMMENLNDTPVFHRFKLFTDPSDSLYPMISGRWMVLKVGSNDLADTWGLRTITIHGKITGTI